MESGFLAFAKGTLAKVSKPVLQLTGSKPSALMARQPIAIPAYVQGERGHLLAAMASFLLRLRQPARRLVLNGTLHWRLCA